MWKKNRAKLEKAHGRSYTSPTTKKLVPARKIGEPCNCGCFEKLGMEAIKEIFDKYWNIGDNYSLSSLYLMNSVAEKVIKRRRTKDEYKATRKLWTYKVRHGGEEHEVCRKAFISIHGITDDKLRKVCRDKQKHATGVPVVIDQRGRQPSANQIKGFRIDKIHEHIQTLVVTKSHHSRAHSPHRSYMQPGTTTSAVFDQYVDWLSLAYPDEEPVLFHKYNDIFTHHYNIVKHPELTDICNFCEEYPIEKEFLQKKGGPDMAKKIKELDTNFNIHKEEASMQVKKLSNFEISCREAGPTDGWRTVCIDMQQTLIVPRLRVNKAYYKTKLWLYNSCVFDLNHYKANCYLWTEMQAMKGSNEVISCLMKWFEENKGEGFRKLRIFADNCYGQNKNIYMILSLLRLVQSGNYNNFIMYKFET